MKTGEKKRIENLSALHSWPVCATCGKFATKKECPYPGTESNHGVCY